MKVAKAFSLFFGLFLVIGSSSGANNKPNCGFKCFRWERCMQQLAGNENRPGQLGDTGQIVLTKCEQGDCDCNQILKDEKAERDNKKVAVAKPVQLEIDPKSTRLSAGGATTQEKRSIISPPVSVTPIRSNLLRRVRTSIYAATPSPVTDKPSSVKITDLRGKTRVGIITGTSVSSSVTSSSSSSTSSRSSSSDRPSSSDLLKSRLKLLAQKRRRY